MFVLSPDFCNSEWAKVERTSSIAGDPAALKRNVRPLMLRPCRDLPTFPCFLRPVQFIDGSTGVLFEQDCPRIRRELGGVPSEDFNTAARNTLPPVHPLPDRHWMPHLSLGDKFVGRVGALWDLYDSLFRDATAVVQGTGVVAGTGGLGKTQLAIEYAHRFSSLYAGGVYWVQADLGLTAMIRRLGTAAKIDVDTKAEEAEQLAQLWQGLNSRRLPCLLILDNFPETVPLQPYLPTTGRVHTIVTTRRQDLAQSTVRLPFLSIEESVRLLNSGESRLGQSAAALAERLGGLPLALELAKSYLNSRQDLTVPKLIRDDTRRRSGGIKRIRCRVSR